MFKKNGGKNLNVVKYCKSFIHLFHFSELNLLPSSRLFCFSFCCQVKFFVSDILTRPTKWIQNGRLSSSRLKAGVQRRTLTGVVGEGAFEAIEDEPALLPRFNLSSHFDQVALTHLFRQDHVVAGVHVVTRRLHVRAQVKLLFADGQVARHGPSLLSQKKRKIYF